VTVARNDHRSRPGVTLLDHDLVADSPTSGVEIDAILLGEFLDVGVLGEVLLRLILDVVVEREDGLGGAMNGGEGERGEPEKRRREGGGRKPGQTKKKSKERVWVELYGQSSCV
jgi:hypothetical protein